MEGDTYLVNAPQYGSEWSSDGITYVYTRYGWIPKVPMPLTEHERESFRPGGES